jgi:type IV secretion system protein VirD4
MKNSNDRQTTAILCVILLIPIVWAALVAAPFLSEGLPGIMDGFTEAMSNPLNIRWVDDSPKCILIFVAAYGMGIVIYLSTRRNYRKGVEHGSAKWGNAEGICKKYRDRSFTDNKILTQNVRIGLDRQETPPQHSSCHGGRRFRLRFKTRFFAKPNVMQAILPLSCWTAKAKFTRHRPFTNSAGYEVRILALSTWNAPTATIRLYTSKRITMCKDS